MAVATLSARQRALRSTVIRKAVMAVTGLMMIGFLIAHMLGNLKLFLGQQHFDEYAHSLRTLGEPILPYGTVLWILRILLLAAVVLHIWSAVTLAARSRAATGASGPRYQSKHSSRVQRTYASYTMRWGGLLIALYVLFHLCHLTWNVIHPGGASDSPFERSYNGFTQWWVVLVYVLAMIVVGLHLRHGIWSALATLGANTGEKVRRRLNLLAVVVSLLITIGFIIPPLAVLSGVIQR